MRFYDVEIRFVGYYHTRLLASNENEAKELAIAELDALEQLPEPGEIEVTVSDEE